jgi:hypothetical protein
LYFINPLKVLEMAKFIKVRTQVLLQAGTAGTTVTNKLTVVSSAGLSVGDIIHNTSDNTFATITVIDSATLVTLSADIMASGETYSAYSATQYVDKPVLAEGVALVKRSASTNYQTTINYSSNSTGTDIITILHQPVASVYVTTVENAIDTAILEVHSNGQRPDVARLVSLPTGIKALAITIA